MRTLIGPESDDLAVLYEPPSLPWLRVNMVSTLDGAANGESGKSGSINNEADKRVFHRPAVNFSLRGRWQQPLSNCRAKS
mgnify:CR=1 FL=1